MRTSKLVVGSAVAALLFALACTGGDKGKTNASKTKIAKGLYSFGPELKTFTECEEGREYWVADSAKALELAYTNLEFEKPYVPVYVEVEYHFIKSDTLAASASFDSTMVVTKLLKISKDIPEGPCAQ